MGESPALNRALDPWLIVLLNLPALVIIILAYVWFGLNEAAAIGAVALNKIPNAIVTMREGARALDPGLDEMARAYRLSYWSKLRNVTLPQLQPYFAAASSSGISLIWKIVLVVELLGQAEWRRLRAPSKLPALQRDGHPRLYRRLRHRHARNRIFAGAAP